MKSIATILLLSSFVSTILGQTPGQWTTRAPMPSMRQETNLAVLNGKIYVPGGFDSAGIVTRTLQVYDPATNTWSFGADLPQPMHHLGVAAANGRLYVLGGYTATGSTAHYAPTTYSFEYNPATNSWAAKAPLPVARGAHVAVSYANKICLMGGIDPISVGSPRNDIYDPATNTWSQAANLPTAREHVTGAVLDSLIYIVGGQLSTGNTTIVEAYSPITNTWYAIPGMPSARHSATTAVVNGRLYVIGGEGPTATGYGELQVNEEYNPITRTWRTMTRMPTPRSHLGGTAYNGKIYVIGGATTVGVGNFHTTGVNEMFDPSGLTAINDPVPDAPRAIRLYQNFPNPFNPATQIRYDVATSGLVQLKIFDMLGREVATLVDGFQFAGAKEISWDGSSSPSGVYYYRLYAGETTEMRSMLLMK